MWGKIIRTRSNKKNLRNWKNIISISTRGLRLSPTVFVNSIWKRQQRDTVAWPEKIFLIRPKFFYRFFQYLNTSWKTFIIASLKISINTSKNTLMSSFSLRQIIHRLMVKYLIFLRQEYNKFATRIATILHKSYTTKAL